MGVVLVVENNRNYRLLLTEELEFEGYSVVTSQNAEEALVALREHPVDLVLLDLRLPDIAAVDFLSQLDGVRPEVPVVIHTGCAASEDAFMPWAAEAYVLKQSDLSELMDTIREVLGDDESPVQELTLTR